VTPPPPACVQPVSPVPEPTQLQAVGPSEANACPPRNVASAQVVRLTAIRPFTRLALPVILDAFNAPGMVKPHQANFVVVVMDDRDPYQSAATARDNRTCFLIENG